MAVSKASTQVTWSSSNSTSVSSGSTATSDAMSISSDSFDAMITFKADNGGTPASGDTIDFYILYSTGDPDGASTDEYDAADTLHGTFLCQLDTNTTDPAQRTVQIPVAAKGFKIFASSNASSNSITVSSELYEASA
jgi:hypothetical protein